MIFLLQKKYNIIQVFDYYICFQLLPGRANYNLALSMDKRADFFSLQTQFQDLVPKITYINTSSSIKDQTKASLDESRERCTVSATWTISLQQKSSLMACEETPKYLIAALCLIEKTVMSTITLNMISKRDPERQAKKKLKSLYMQITVLKFALSQYGQLLLIAGTSCGRLLFYRNIQKGEINVDSLHFSPHRVLGLIVPSFKNSLFVLTANGTIYLIDTKDKLIHYQFQCELPHIEDTKLFFFMDSAQNYICCAYRHGRIIVWEITNKMKEQFELENKFTIEEGAKNSKFLKKQGKQKITRNIIFKPKISLLCCIREGIQWISFFGSFIGVLTSANTFKIMAINLSSCVESTQLFLTLNSFPLVAFQDGAEDQYETISSIEKWQEGIMVGSICLGAKEKVVSSRLVRYTFSSDFQVKKTEQMTLPSKNTLRDCFQDASNTIFLCRFDESLDMIMVTFQF